MRRAWLTTVALLGVVSAASHPRVRRHAGEALGGASRLLTTPTDRVLEQARDRLLLVLPLAADTKWRALRGLVACLIVDLVQRDAAAAGTTLAHVGQRYAEETDADGVWDAASVVEAAHRLTESLEMEGEVLRAGSVVTLVTRSCPLVEASPPASRSAVCEAVCGERASLLSGLAASARVALTSPQRMGDGAPHCVRELDLGAPRHDAVNA